MVVAVVSAVLWLWAAQAVTATPSEVEASEAERLFRFIGQARAEHARPPLERDPRLDALAFMKAQEMAEKGYFDHVSPDYGTVFDMLEAEGIPFKWAGENIARAADATVAHDALMQSPDHRANILSAGYTHVGIGVARDGRRLYVVQLFLKPRA